MKFIGALLLINLLTALGACTQGTSTASELQSVSGDGLAATTWPSLIQTRFETVNNIPMVQATVDGRTGNFLLDTGSETTLLNQAFFKGTVLKGPHGSGSTGAFQQVSSYRVKQFEWQGVRFQNAAVATLDLNHLSTNDHPLLGLIGSDLLMHYVVTLNYKTNTLRLSAPEVVQPQSMVLLTLPFTLQGHLPVIPVAIAGKQYNLTIDSGASINMLSAKLLPALTTELLNVSASTFSGASSTVASGQTGTLKKAVIGNKVLLLNMATVFTSIGPLMASKPTPIDGILGYEFLRQYQVTIDYPGRRIQLR